MRETRPRSKWWLLSLAALVLAGRVGRLGGAPGSSSVKKLVDSAGLVHGASIISDARVTTQRDAAGTVRMHITLPQWGPVRLQALPKNEVVVKLGKSPQGGSPGEPMLPHTSVRVLLPPDADLATVRAELASGDWEQLPGEHDIAPVPPAATWDGDRHVLDWGGKDERLIVNGRDSSLYEKDDYFPHEPVEVVSVGAFRQWKLAELRVWLAAYNPVRRKIRILRNAKTSLSARILAGPLAVGLNSARPPKSPGSANFASELFAGVANPRDFETFYGSLEGTSASTYDYVIITTDAIKNNSNKLTSFVSAKQAAGHSVKVVTEGRTADGTHYLRGSSADSRTDNIRSWLKTNWTTDGIEYVLLIGNPHPTNFSSATSVPMKMCHPHATSPQYNPVPTDMYFAELSGTWDADNDANYGEFVDDYNAPGGVDKYCEVKVGRIPFYGSYTNLDAILQKTIDYGSAETDLAWRGKVLIPAAISNHGPQDNIPYGNAVSTEDYPTSWRTFGDDWGEALKLITTASGFSPYTLYEKEGVYSNGTAYPLTLCDANLTQGNLIDEWKTTYGFVTWWGHGSQRGAYRRVWQNDNWTPPISPPPPPDHLTQHPQETSSPALFSWSDCSQLNDDHPSFVVQVSCENGYPEDSNNLAYALLKNGAVGTIAGTRITWYHMGSWGITLGNTYGDNASYGYYGFNRMALDEGAGDALVWCRANFGTMWSSGSSWMNMVCFNLYGDPALSLAIKPIKWLQMPDLTPNGIDIRCSRDRRPPGPGQDPHDPNLIVPWDMADDFECNRPGPITGVTFWGSWISDVKGEIQEIHLSIYDDVPDMDGPGPMYSMPGQELWSKDFDAGEFTESLFYTSTEQGEWFWMHPPSPSITQGADRQVWLYHVPIDAGDAFTQEGDPCHPVIYWLGIHALLEIDPNFKPAFGWKTRDPYPPGVPGQLEYCHFNDDAVRSDDDCNTWAELRYPSVHPYAFNLFNPDANSIDMSFAIISFEQEPPALKPPVPHLKWSQPPIEIDPAGRTPTYCGWNEPSLRAWDPTWFDCWDCRTQCHGDADCNGFVGTNDLVILQSAVPPNPYDARADFNRDLGIGAADLQILQRNWQTNPAADCRQRPPYWYLAADDFRCLGTMPITSVHWWGSYVGWDEPQPPQIVPTAWQIGFWSNVGDPNVHNPDDYSYPKELLWRIDLPAERVEQIWVGDDYFPDPLIPSDTCFQHYVHLDPNEYFWQGDYNDVTEDSVFWLSIGAVYPNDVNQAAFPWGWKTRPWPWMDDAVTFGLAAADLKPGVELGSGDITRLEYEGQSYDLAFELDTDPNWIKAEQAFTGIRRWPHYEDELSMARRQVTTYPLTDDTTIDQIQPNNNAGSLSSLIVRRSCSGWELDTLLRFDISSLPVGTAINSAAIKLYYWHWNDYNPAGTSLTIHPITGAWDEATTVWNNRPSYDPNVTSSDAVPSSYGWMQWDVTSDVQGFVNGSKTNFGWLIKDPTGGSYPCPMIYFRSKESADSNYHPCLDIDYQGPGPQLDIGRLIADDWLCKQKTPVTAAVWWGSYLGYEYEACQPEMEDAPTKPDYFLLTIWNDVPADADPCASYSHPNDIIWQYTAYDYDEVLVGYDKEPHDQTGPPREPVFRYSVRLPEVNWFHQEDVNNVYWFSVVAVYKDVPAYPWGWTNHRHTFNDDAVAGYPDASGTAWIWEEIYDQNNASADMSFVLFTEPDCLRRIAPEYIDWVAWNRPDCWCYPRQCRGDADGVQTGPFWVAIPDLNTLRNCINVFDPLLPPGCICADFDHIKTGPFRVAIPDLNILRQYINRFSAQVPICDQPPVYTGPYNFWTSP